MARLVRHCNGETRRNRVGQTYSRGAASLLDRPCRVPSRISGRSHWQPGIPVTITVEVTDAGECATCR